MSMPAFQAQTATTIPLQRTVKPVQNDAAAKLKYRCKADIIAAILEAASSGEVPKSRLYYKSFLTYNRLRGYLLLVIDAGLMEYFDYRDTRLYKTTEKGILFLQAYDAIRELTG